MPIESKYQLPSGEWTTSAERYRLDWDGVATAVEDLFPGYRMEQYEPVMTFSNGTDTLSLLPGQAWLLYKSHREQVEQAVDMAAKDGA